MCVNTVHGVCFARVGNAVAENEQIIAGKEALEARIDGREEEVFLRDLRLKDVREMEALLLWRAAVALHRLLGYADAHFRVRQNGKVVLLLLFEYTK